MSGFQTTFQREMARLMLAQPDKYYLVDEPTHTLRGTVMERWLKSIADEDRGIPTCPHWLPYMPGVLSVDVLEPRVECGPCAVAHLTDEDELIKADRTCRLCGRISQTFTEFMLPAEMGVAIMGHACDTCIAEIGPGVPA